MTSKAAIDQFMSQQVLAVVGASTNPQKFGNIAYKEFRAKGYRVLAVNPNAQVVEGDPAYPSLKDLPEKVGGVIFTTQPAVTEKMVNEAVEQGITNIWMQAGSESAVAVQYCQENNLNVISGECLLMYLPKTSFPHKIHKFIKETFGGKPE